MTKIKRTYLVDTSVPFTIRLKDAEGKNGKNRTKHGNPKKKREIVITSEMILRIINHIKEL